MAVLTSNTTQTRISELSTRYNISMLNTSHTSMISAGHTLSLTMSTLYDTTFRQQTTINSTVGPLPESIQDFVFYSEAIVQPCILCLGFIFNCINLAVLKKARIAAMFQVCLLALTVSDILVCIFGTAQLLVEGIVFRGEIPFGYWHGAALASHLLYYVFVAMLCNSSLYVIVAASVRARMISQPYKIIDNTKLHKVRRILLLTIAVTVVFFLPCPIYAMWQVCYNETERRQCQEFFRRFPHVDSMQYYFYALSLVFGPVIIIANIICFIVIKAALRRSTERLAQLKKDSRRRHQYHRITRMLLVILVLDTLWILPSSVQYLGLALSPRNTIFNKHDTAYVVFDIVAEILLLFRPTYNIFVYLITNREYRQQFKIIFCCWHKSENFMLTSSADSVSTSPEHTPKRLSKIVDQSIDSINQRHVTKENVSQSNGVLHKQGRHTNTGLLDDLHLDIGQKFHKNSEDTYALSEQANVSTEERTNGQQENSNSKQMNLENKAVDKL